MPPDEHNAAQHWRALALLAIGEAQEATDADCKAVLMHIAGAYERLAEKAERALDTILDAPQPFPEKE